MNSFVLSLLVSILLLGCSQLPSSTSYQGHGAQSVSPEDLEKYAPAPLSRTETERLEALMDIRSPSAGLVDENLSDVVFNWSISGVNHVWRHQLSGFPQQMTGGLDAAYVVARTSDKAILIRDRAGDEYYGLYELDLKTGAIETIYAKERVSAGFQELSDDGRYLYYYANDRLPEQYALYRYDRVKKESKLLLDRPGFWRIADRREGGGLLVVRLKTNVNKEYFLLDEQTLELQPILGQEEDQDYQLAFSERADEYFVKTNKFGEFHRLYRYKVQDQSWTPITGEVAADVGGFEYHPKKKRLIYSVNEQGYIKPRVREGGDLRPMELPFFDKLEHVENIYFGSTTLNERYTTVNIERYNRPDQTGVIDWQKKELIFLTLASTPEIQTDTFARDSLEFYPARDGTQIPMFVKRPAECQNKLCPVIVNFHGGPESQARPGFSPVSQAYVEAGFVYVRPNVRGSRGYGKTWLDADNGPKRLEVISDIADAALYIKKHWARDGVAPKVGVMGGSYGGYSTFFAMTKYAGVYDAGVANVGMSSLVTFLQNTAPYRRALRESEYGYLDRDMEALIALSPVTYLDQIQDPLLILHGATDPRVPAGEAIQIKRMMDQKGIAGELILFADEGHGVRRRENRVLSLGHTLRFFNRHLRAQDQ